MSYKHAVVYYNKCKNCDSEFLTDSIIKTCINCSKEEIVIRKAVTLFLTPKTSYNLVRLKRNELLSEYKEALRKLDEIITESRSLKSIILRLYDNTEVC